MLPWAWGLLAVTWRGLGKIWSTLDLFGYPDALSRDKSSPRYSCSLVASQHKSRSGTGEEGNAVVCFSITYGRVILMTIA